jgi:intracellular sulfur oxidation DsrE/DsrF family protein
VRVTRTVIIKSDVMGIDPPELGATMIGSYLRKLCVADPKPSSLVFYGTGVKLVVEGSVVLDALEILGHAGVDLVVCGTCVGFFQLKDKLRLGRISNMPEIISLLTNSDHVVTL